ncbi:Uncharacterised protein [Vibrio cholerae]|uniref:Uncharacterized protein n=1 Tax=Vibrio cholerae TaxID=666 RepID=A0A655PA64_VIBCL|nr:Uncharacterised protein [Vibrio cholerae]CSA88094.1 Uncharacterised protein [Vibrio cholerae]
MIGKFSQQGAKQRIVTRATSKSEARIVQAATNTVTQLCSGRFGKSHHQNLIHTQWMRVTSFRAAMSKHQTQIESGNGVGFSGACRGLNQPRSMQRKTQRIERNSELI